MSNPLPRLLHAQYEYRDVVIDIQRINDAHYRYDVKLVEPGGIGLLLHKQGNDVTHHMVLETALERIDFYYDNLNEDYG